MLFQMRRDAPLHQLNFYFIIYISILFLCKNHPAGMQRRILISPILVKGLRLAINSSIRAIAILFYPQQLLKAKAFTFTVVGIGKGMFVIVV